MSGFGMRREPDRSQNEDYLVTSRRRHLLTAPIRSTLWRMGTLLDQGQTGTCVGHGHKGALLASPVRSGTPKRVPTPFDIYRGACLLDPWTDNDDQGLDWGTSVRAGADWLLKSGHIQQYVWAYTVDDIIAALQLGPVVIGIDWFHGMMQVDAEGIIRPTGPAMGGHCTYLSGWDNGRGRFVLINSWGHEFGRLLPSGKRNGRAYLMAEDYRARLEHGGEAVQLVETL